MAGSKACNLLLKHWGALYFVDFGDYLKLVEVIAGARYKITESKLRNAIKPLKGVKLTKARADFRRVVGE